MNDLIDKSEILHELDNYEKGKGSWVFSEINGVKTKVYTKYFTGTTDGDAETVVAHGVTGAKILSANVMVRTAGFGNWLVKELFYGANAGWQWIIYINEVNIVLYLVGASSQSKPYVIKIDYYE